MGMLFHVSYVHDNAFIKAARKFIYPFLEQAQTRWELNGIIKEFGYGIRFMQSRMKSQLAY
jgi:hypothetical protein